eukprot:scaffold79600_cov65-Attheya_sp.AAC.2
MILESTGTALRGEVGDRSGTKKMIPEGYDYDVNYTFFINISMVIRNLLVVVTPNEEQGEYQVQRGCGDHAQDKQNHD